MSTAIVNVTYTFHTCSQISEKTIENSVLDACEEMKQVVQYQSTNYIHKSAHEIANDVSDMFDEKYSTVPHTFLGIHQLKALVYSTRKDEYGEWRQRICIAPLVLCSETDSRLFLRFDFTVAIKDKNTDHLETFLGWAHPDLMFELNHDK